MQWILGILVWGLASEFVEEITGWSFTTSKVATAVAVAVVLVVLSAGRAKPAAADAVPAGATPSVAAPDAVPAQPTRPSAWQRFKDGYREGRSG